MTNEQAAQILRDHNEWRRDRSETAPIGMPKSYNPTLLGQAIDVAVKALEQTEPTELERFKDKADKWDALDEKIGAFYGDDVLPEDDEAGLIGIGEIAATAFGYM